MSQTSRVFGLDLLRCLAILAVLASHSLWIFPPFSGFLYDVISVLGVLGVELFFVLSGFLIGSILYRSWVVQLAGPKQGLHFLMRRWLRTLPNYYLFLILTIAVAFFVNYPVGQLWRYVFFVQNFSSPMPSFFHESWSLAVEEWGYLLWAVVLFLLGNLVPTTKRSAYFLFVTLAFILGGLILKYTFYLANAQLDMTQWNVGLKSVVIYRIDALAWGVLASYLMHTFAGFWNKSRFVAALIGTCILFFVFAGVGYFRLLIDSNLFFWVMIYLPLISLMVFCFLPLLSAWQTARGVIANAVVYISKISYSIYLAHYSFVLWLMKFLFPTAGLSLPQLLLYTFAYLAVVFIVASLAYRFFEKPILDLRDKWLTKS